MEQNQCVNCIHFKPAEASQPPGNGFCRRYPPVVIRTAGSAKAAHQVTCARPVVQVDDSCGEFRQDSSKAPSKPRRLGQE
jgi:hypothetical protein